MLTVAARHEFSGFELDAKFSSDHGITVLFGASGSGKSTIAHVVSGLLRPMAGHVALGDHVLFDGDTRIWVPPHRRRIGYIFQDARLFPHLTVRANLRFGAWFARHRPSADEFSRITEMLGLGPVLDRRPAHLSGGEKQRVAIGRALLSNPRLIIADEPLAALDQARKAEILPYFERLRDEVKVPMLYVSHSSAEVARLATTVVALSDGKVLRQGEPSVIFGDPSVLPLGPRGAGSVLDALVKEQHPDGLTELVAGGQPLFVPQIPHPVGGQVSLRISAHDVILARSRPLDISALNVVPCTITKIRAGDGPGAMVALHSAAGSFLARVTKRSIQRLGLSQGVDCFAIIKSVAIAPKDIS
ncbi:molybdenum ABC transporter ATP-binding protein [Epibacterium sp. SM1979]|uniref:Molybdenum ABC transporter ATP-binding protein n=1 Tax=Tritonibacter litoralis TaxID=2662264 RepID=A0A843YL35_9RHOB|nr:molybdenum ABC transporter ATP-binding protein [Tritonibacter litoralis]MQQ10134.1 molybdenum ABC transporter ATP-binding protein [Tritonibacter litoralis]